MTCIVNGHPVNASQEVIDFIDDIYASQPREHNEAIRSLFHNGYCYYFANMLKMAFGRGTVCLAYPFGHIVWLDTDGIAYDIEGVTISEYEKLVDIECLPELKYDFMHVRGLQSPPDIKERVDKLLLEHPEFIKR